MQNRTKSRTWALPIKVSRRESEALSSGSTVHDALIRAAADSISAAVCALHAARSKLTLCGQVMRLR